MKKLSFLFALLLVLGSFGSASAIDQTGKFAVGGHFGYSFGFGDVFKEYEWSHDDPLTGHWEAKYQNKVTFSFRGNVKYGLNPNLALMGAVDYQAGDVEITGAAGGISPGISDSYHWTSILGNLLFNLSPEENTCPYFTGGLGLYMNDNVTKPGVNLGGGIEHFFQENLALDVGTRFHMIFTQEQKTNYLNMYVGLNYYFGVE